MPGFNGTGPLGMGPMTGRGLGYCAIPYPNYGRFTLPYVYGGTLPVAYMPNIVPRMMPFWGRPGFGRGFGMGRVGS